jgi:hypothetical protein
VSAPNSKKSVIQKPAINLVKGGGQLHMDSSVDKQSFVSISNEMAALLHPKTRNSPLRT